MTITANATGGSGRYEHLFRLRDPSGTWTIVQGYGGGDSFVWDPAAAGTWVIEVHTRNAGTLAVLEATEQMQFEVVSGILLPDGRSAGR